MIVQLVLAAGSQAGVTASMQLGYYMIGRHAECQIRPKSRSVSRRHCLLHHTETELRVLDLNSASGTRINGQRIAPGQWIELTDADSLRCGKVAFEVSLQRRSVAAATDEDDRGHEKTPSTSMLQGDAWQELDVAGLLESADAAARDERYSRIRSQAMRAAAAELAEDAQLVDTLVEPDEPIAKERPAAKQRDQRSAAMKQRRAEPRRSSKSASSRSLPSLARFRNDGSLKWMGAVLLTLCVLGFLGYSVYRFNAGPPTRILSEID
ncbi:FHA domain-containing protein [Novipirellula artificiosorum]|nr:FHA domain-containing protein [Novipirellula artificiosorum]